MQQSLKNIGLTNCQDVGPTLFKYIAQARETLDELYGAIEEFKDPTELARVAKVFTATPQTPEAQMEFIQARITKAGVSINVVHAAVENWMATGTCMQKKQQRRRKAAKRLCDECGKLAHKESPLHTTRQWAVCTQCVSRPTPLRCDFCNQEDDETHRMLRSSTSALCFRCACVPPPRPPAVNDDQK